MSEKRRDTIDLPVSESLDVSGWDLRKALQLFARSNPPLFEWLYSPVVYRGCEGDAGDGGSLLRQMRELAMSVFSPNACCHHYYNWMMKKYRANTGDAQSLKSFMYVVRPVLAIRWLEQGKGLVPTGFAELLEGVLNEEKAQEAAVKKAIQELVRDRMERREPTGKPHLKLVQTFTRREVERFRARKFPKDNHRDVSRGDVLDRLFFDLVTEKVH